MKGGLGLVISVVIAIYLAIDAPKHNKRSWLWAILGLFFGPIALGIYLIQTGRKVLGWIILVVVGLLYIFLIFLFIAAIFLLQGM
ncbi:hypothetical protein [Neobacillus mesonae]|uniref:Major facilitator superfamily (MFS) profile domain-containing protein n=1 Tax=Neobacillus mesonae TaxID=1193713 RepID=A0A3Q9QYM6_9BACI|nr:hypothetical protein [Neobacillus mesonae]AZU64533.1 hypothetical protein CHR53_26715 [Neobacillus mesonae]MED4202944.1 hypothetical protein [Neobacillus mesonae]